MAMNRRGRHPAAVVSLAVVATTAVLPAVAGPPAGQGTTRVSVADTAEEGGGDGRSGEPSVSLDGRFVAFESVATDLVAGDTNGASDVFVRDRRTGRTTVVSLRPGDGRQFVGASRAAAISGNGRHVAFQSVAVPPSENGAVSGEEEPSAPELPAPSEAPVPLPERPPPSGGLPLPPPPGPSPPDDGAGLPSFRLPLVAAAGGDPVHLPRRAVRITSQPRLQRLVFASNRDDLTDADIFVMDGDGGVSANITRTPGLIEIRPGPRVRVHTDAVNLTGTPGVLEAWPAFSPDGNRIAFTRLDVRDKRLTNVYVMDADGRNLTRLTSGGFNQRPTWSPDGGRIAFWRVRRGRFEIVVMRADGAQQRVIAFGGVLHRPRDPAWSPDGTRIAFAAARGTDELTNIYVADLTRRRFRRITSDDAGDVEPRWSPDGRRIAFTTAGRRRLPDGVAEVYVVDVDDGRLQRLTDHLLPSVSPAWRGDGGRIVVSSARSVADLDTPAMSELYGFDPRSTESSATRLTVNPQGAAGITTTADYAPTQLGSATPAADTAVVSAGPGRLTPTGEVTFFLCAPREVTAEGCTAGRRIGTPVRLVESTPGTAVATSQRTSEVAPPVAFDEPGTWCWRADYSGDAFYSPASDLDPSRECFAVTKQRPALAAVGVPSGSVAPGAPVADRVTVSGTDAAPAGLVTFHLCDPAVVTGAGCVSGGRRVGQAVPLQATRDGSARATSVRIAAPDEPGTYCWRAEYAGDGTYQPVTATDPATQCFTVGRRHARLTTVATPRGGGAAAGSPAAVTATIAGDRGTRPTGAVTFYLCAPEDVAPWGCPAGNRIGRPVPVRDGKATSAATTVPRAPGTYCWRAEYSGDRRYAPAVHTDAATTCFTVDVAPPADEFTAVYIHDRARGATTLVSAGEGGAPADGPSGEPSVSGDGRFVAFTSTATNLAPGDTRDATNVFVRDLTTGLTTLVSTHGRCAAGPDEPCVAGDSFAPSISADGRHVAFASYADDLTPGRVGAPSVAGSAPVAQVYVHDLHTRRTTIASVGSLDRPGRGDSFAPSISADGARVAFVSLADDLVTGDTNDAADVFVRDRAAVATLRVSVDSGGAEADLASGDPSISADGRYVAYASQAANLVPADTNAACSPGCPSDVFVHDLLTRRTTRGSVGSTGTQTRFGSDSGAPALSGDGRYVAFHSDDDGLVAGDGNGLRDVFVHDRVGVPITPVEVLAVTPDPVDFAEQPVGSRSGTRPVTVTNTGDEPVRLGRPGISGPHGDDFELAADRCAGTVLAPGGTCMLELRFAPGDTGGRSAVLSVPPAEREAVAPAAGALRGIGVPPAVRLTPDPVTFDDQRVGTPSDPRQVTVTNDFDGPVRISTVTVRGPHAADYRLDHDGCARRRLEPQARCRLLISFRPDGEGRRRAEVVVGHDAPGSPGGSPLNGLGVRPRLSIDVDEVDFGDQPVGVPGQSRTVTVRNVGSGPGGVTAAGLGGEDAGDFRLDLGGCADATLEPGAACEMRVGFVPTAPGRRTATLTVTGDDPTAPPVTAVVVGVGRGPLLVVEPRPVDLGAWVVGATGIDHEVTLANEGNEPLAVERVEVRPAADPAAPAEPEPDPATPADFAVVGDRCSGTAVAPGSGCAVVLRFAPTAAGERRATLAVTSASGAEDVAVRGEGLVPRLTLDPPLGRGGFAPTVLGEDFPPEVELDLVWSRGSGTLRVATDADGRFTASMLVLRREDLGLRALEARPVSAPPFVVTADYLVVPGTVRPPDFLSRD